MTLLFVRHGQTDWNINTLVQGRTNNPLNEHGKAQAVLVGNYLKEVDKDWDIAISSPLIRAYETAEIITDLIGFKGEIITNESFLERDFGNLDGIPLTKEVYDILENNSNPTVETFESLQTRVVAAMREIAKKYAGKRVIIFAHAQVIKSAINYFDPRFNFRDLLLNSSMNYFEADGDDIKVLKYNVVPEGHVQFL